MVYMSPMYGEKVTRLTLGDLFSCLGPVSSEGDAQGKQKSAEAIVMKEKAAMFFFFHEGLNVNNGIGQRRCNT